MTPLPFNNARIFDGANAECAEGMHVRVADGQRWSMQNIEAIG